jgi:large subunit ribosomal protein L6
MSRIGKLPIVLPSGVKINWREPLIEVTGPKGKLTKTLHSNVSLKEEKGQISIAPKDNNPTSKAIWGLTRTLVNNMVQGVSAGFTKRMEIVGVGWKVELAEPKVLKLILGYSNPIMFKLPDGVEPIIDPKVVTKFGLTSPDKELLGLTCARIRSYREPEPYKGKGIKYEGEFIVRKVRKGKAGAK